MRPTMCGRLSGGTWRFASEFELSNGSYANGILGSQVGSQWGPVPSHVQRWLAIILAAQRHTKRHQATSADYLVLIWEQEAAGSNPAIPTRSEHMSILNDSARGATGGGSWSGRASEACGPLHDSQTGTHSQ